MDQRTHKINIKGMAYSPNRKNYTITGFRRQLYTQNRQENLNQTNLSQRSPSIRSPKLNEQSEYTKLRDVGLVEQLRIKLETVLRHNSQLLNENATLSEMVNTLKMQLESLSRKEEGQTYRLTNQLRLTITSLQQQQKMQQNELSRLLDQISRLHDDCYRIQCDKNNEIKILTEKHEKETTAQIRNLKRSSEDAKELYQIQIRKLKETTEMNNFEYEALKSQLKIDNDKLKGEVEELKNQIKHIHQVKDIQIRQLTESHRENLQSSIKQLERENTITISKLEAKTKKFKQDLINKTLQMEQTSRKSVQNSQEHLQQIEELKVQRQKLLEEFMDMETSGKENFLKEKSRLREISEMEIKNLEGMAENQRECLKSEINKLSTLCMSKTDEIRKLYANIAATKETNTAERKDLDRLIEELRKRIKVLEQDNQEQLQLLKIKMAQLHQSDIVSLQKYYETQVALLLAKIKQLEEEKGADRARIHQLLQENDELRKKFEMELIKYKAKVQDYKVKFAAANLEFREQITSIGTKMELTSQTLLRQTDQKQKGAQFFENEKKKFHALIAGKDKEISSAYEAMNRQKQLHAEQVKQLRDDLASVREALSAKATELKNLKKNLQEEFERKSQKLIAEKVQSPNDVLNNENIELRNRLEAADKEILQKTKDIEFLQKENKSLQQEVGLRAGFLETMQLESSAAIEDEKSKLKILMNENEVAMKDYYETKLNSKDKDIDALRDQLHEKEKDIRQLIVKYNQLEKRLQELLQAQDKLSEFEQKIVNMGMDQNLIKNMGELFARHRK